MEPVPNLSPIIRSLAPYPSKSSRTNPSEPGRAPTDSVQLSDDAVAADNGEATASRPRTYGPRGTFVHDTAGRQSGLAADTDRSRHLTDILSEIAAVQQNTAELLDRQRHLRV